VLYFSSYDGHELDYYNLSRHNNPLTLVSVSSTSLQSTFSRLLATRCLFFFYFYYFLGLGLIAQYSALFYYEGKRILAYLNVAVSASRNLGHFSRPLHGISAWFLFELSFTVTRVLPCLSFFGLSESKLVLDDGSALSFFPSSRQCLVRSNI